MTSQLSPGTEIHSVFHTPHDSFHKGGWATFAARLLCYLGFSGPSEGFIPSDNPQKCQFDASWQNFFAVKVTANSKNGFLNGTNVKTGQWKKTSASLTVCLIQLVFDIHHRVLFPLQDPCLIHCMWWTCSEVNQSYTVKDTICRTPASFVRCVLSETRDCRREREDFTAEAVKFWPDSWLLFCTWPFLYDSFWVFLKQLLCQGLFNCVFLIL